MRLPGRNYAEGMFFVTLCTHDRGPLFGEIVDGRVCLNQFGAIAREQWLSLPTRFTHVTLGEWCLMPDHLHGLLTLRRIESGAAVAAAALGKPLGRVIGAFKTMSTSRINQARDRPGALVWQRDFWDRVVRDFDEAERIAEYIRTNPGRWSATRPSL